MPKRTFKQADAPAVLAFCPFCDARVPDAECPHFVGWTTDGLTITEPYVGRCVPGSPILPTDKVIKTGVSARVYSGGM